MNLPCGICSAAQSYTFYSPSRGYACFECDMMVDRFRVLEFTAQNQYAHDHPCTKCGRRNTRSVRYPVRCCVECAQRYHLTFDVYVTDARVKSRHPVNISYDKAVGILARRVSRFGGGIEYNGVVYDPSVILRDLKVVPGDDFVFYGTPDEYADHQADH